MEKSVSKDRKDGGDGGETKDSFWLKDRNAEKKTGGKVEDGRSKDLEVVFVRNQDGEESIRGTAHGRCLEGKPERTCLDVSRGGTVKMLVEGC